MYSNVLHLTIDISISIRCSAYTIYFYVSLYSRSCAHDCLGVLEHVYLRVCHVMFSLITFLRYVLRRGFSLKQEIPNMTGLPGWGAPEIPKFPHAQCWDYRCAPQTPALLCGFWALKLSSPC